MLRFATLLAIACVACSEPGTRPQSSDARGTRSQSSDAQGIAAQNVREVPAPDLGPGPAQEIRSVYTSLEECRQEGEADEENGRDPVLVCPGVGGYRIRMWFSAMGTHFSVVTPEDSSYTLRPPPEADGRSTSAGPRAEWRVREGGGASRPFAVIVRLNVAPGPEDGAARRRSYLGVARIDGAGVCITEWIAPASDANEQARKAADRAAAQPCL